MPNLEGFVDSDLLNQYLNIKQEPDDNIIVAQPLTGGNTRSKTGQGIPDSLEPAEDIPASQPLKGGNAGPDATQEISGNHDPAVIVTSEISSDNDIENPEDVQVVSLNPILLKENSVQAMLNCCKVSAPASLFSICMDYISWNPMVKYRCCMVLPWSMKTLRYVLELQ